MAFMSSILQEMIAGEEQDNTDVQYVVRVGTKGYGLVALFRLKVE